MPKAKDLIRILGGLFVFVSGLLLLGVFGWEPPVAGPAARPFQTAMHGTGYILPVITMTFLVTGASLISNLFGAASSLALLPISVNIVLYHAILDAGQLPLAIAFFAVNCYVLWYYRSQFELLFRSRPTD